MTPIGDMAWYREIQQGQRLFQGELLFGCPALAWKPEPFKVGRPLEEMIGTENVDVVVMSQDCDIDNGNLQYCVLCPHYSLLEWKELWKKERLAQRKKIDGNAWDSHLRQLGAGSIWSLSLLERVPDGDLRVVDFKEVYSLPIVFLQSWVNDGERRRILLMPPYREHLAQAFARFFMRVGLPTPISQ